jgi:hypothetical protein
MIQGRMVKTPHGIFRLKMAGGEVPKSDMAKTDVTIEDAGLT